MMQHNATIYSAPAYSDLSNKRGGPNEPGDRIFFSFVLVKKRGVEIYFFFCVGEKTLNWEALSKRIRCVARLLERSK